MFHAIASAFPVVMAEPDLSGVAITTDMLSPIIDSITANIGVILPVGIAIFGILLGVSLVPKIIKHFKG